MFIYQKILFIVFVSLFTNVVYAQNPPISSNELDEQFTPKGTGPLGSASKSKTSYSSSNSDYPKNIIKFVPTMIGRSVIAFGYERNFHENFSLVAGVGFNYDKDRIFSSFGSELILTENEARNNQVSISEVIPYCKHDGVSPYLSIGPKFMYESYFFDGSGYFEFSFSHFANKMKYYEPDYYSSSDTKFVGSRDLKYSYNTFSLKYGYHIVTDGKIPTTHEFFFSFGYRMIKYNPVVAADLTNGGMNYNTAYRTEISILNTKESQPSFMFGMGYAFGIGF